MRTPTLPQPQPPTEAEARITSRATRAEIRIARRQRDSILAYVAKLETSAGFSRTDLAAFPEPTEPTRAVGWLKQYADLLQGAHRQRLTVEALEASVASEGCQHVCSVHPNRALLELEAARSEYAHLCNTLARYGASPNP